MKKFITLAITAAAVVGVIALKAAPKAAIVAAVVAEEAYNADIEFVYTDVTLAEFDLSPLDISVDCQSQGGDHAEKRFVYAKNTKGMHVVCIKEKS